VRIVHVPYKGTTEMTTSLFAGQVQLAFVTITAAAPLMKAGKVKALAITSAKPSPLAPDLPLLSDTVPGCVSGGEVAMLGPAGLPQPIVERLNRDLKQLLNAAGPRERLLNAGFEVIGGSPEELAAWIRRESARWSQVIRDAGIRSQ
jgi:tripartite-type tricarboxylate transporter receptor subunit TctC